MSSVTNTSVMGPVTFSVAGSAPPRRADRRGRRERGAGASDPVAQAALAEQADRRARQALADAAASGSPMIDPLGRQRSPVTLPEYRRGRAPANKGRKFPPEVLSGEEMLALLDALPVRGLAAARNRALIVMLWRAGLRIAEALALEPKDLNLQTGSVTVLHGKGDKRREAAGLLDPVARGYLEAWLADRAGLELPAGAPLFCGTLPGVAGRPVSRSYVTEMLKRYARKAGITKRVHPHGLRHTCAVDLASAGVPVHLIQQQLGHTDLRMTAHYINHLSPHERLDRINGARPWPGAPVIAPAPALSEAASQTTTPSPTAPVLRMDPPEIRGEVAARVRETMHSDRRVIELLAANGGEASQAQLRDALGLRRHENARLLRQLYRLHEQGRIIRAGRDRRQSIIWKLAPPPVRLKRINEHRPAPRGEALNRVLDVIEGLGGRASQAQIARALGVSPQSVRKQCQQLARERLLEEGTLDKSSPGIGSRVWRLSAEHQRFSSPRPSGWTMRLAAPPAVR